MSELHAVLTKKNGKWMIENLDHNYRTFLNSIPIETNREKSVENGDVIFIMGLKIIIIGEYIFLNSPQKSVEYNAGSFMLSENDDDEKYETVEEEEYNAKQVEMYSEKDYFSRAPRIRNIIEHETIKIDPPPSAEKSEEFPVFLTLGTTISTGAMMIVSTYASLSGMLKNDTSTSQIVTTIIIALIMLVSTIVLPVLMNKYQ